VEAAYITRLYVVIDLIFGHSRRSSIRCVMACLIRGGVFVGSMKNIKRMYVILAFGFNTDFNTYEFPIFTTSEHIRTSNRNPGQIGKVVVQLMGTYAKLCSGERVDITISSFRFVNSKHKRMLDSQ